MATADPACQWGTISSSRTCTDTVAGVHQYVVCGFSLASGLGVGSSVRSDVFVACGLYWQIECFPAGIDAANSEYVALVVHVAGDASYARQLRVLHSLAILDQAGRDEHIVCTRRREDGPEALDDSGYLAVYPRFAKRSFLRERGSTYLRSDMLVLRCAIEVVRSWTSRIATAGSRTYVPGRQPPSMALLGTGPGAPLATYSATYRPPAYGQGFEPGGMYAPGHTASGHVSGCACCGAQGTGAHWPGSNPTLSLDSYGGAYGGGYAAGHVTGCTCWACGRFGGRSATCTGSLHNGRLGDAWVRA